VTVHARHQAQSDGPPHRLRHTPLVHRTQARVGVVPDAAHIRHVFAHDAKILVMLQRVHAELVKHVSPRLRLAPHTLPFGHLDAGEVMRCVDVARAPTARLLLLELSACVSARHVFELLLPLSLFARPSDFAHRVACYIQTSLPLLGGDAAGWCVEAGAGGAFGANAL